MSRKKADKTYPNKILPTVISDMWCYFRHGYTFAEFVDRNTHGRNYGEEFRELWNEEKAKYDAQKGADAHD